MMNTKTSLVDAKQNHKDAMECARLYASSGCVCCLPHVMMLHAEVDELNSILDEGELLHKDKTFSEETLAMMYEQVSLIIVGAVSKCRLRQCLTKMDNVKEGRSEDSDAQATGKSFIEMVLGSFMAGPPPSKKQRHDA